MFAVKKSSLFNTANTYCPSLISILPWASSRPGRVVVCIIQGHGLSQKNSRNLQLHLDMDAWADMVLSTTRGRLLQPPRCACSPVDRKSALDAHPPGRELSRSYSENQARRSPPARELRADPLQRGSARACHVLSGSSPHGNSVLS